MGMGVAWNAGVKGGWAGRGVGACLSGLPPRAHRAKRFRPGFTKRGKPGMEGGAVMGNGGRWCTAVPMKQNIRSTSNA